MVHVCILGVISVASLTFTAHSNAVTINTVSVGQPGNLPDAVHPHFSNPDNLSYGAVDYYYRIGTYEVTNDQYASFLNAKAKSDPLALYDVRMGSNELGYRRGGITRSGSNGHYVYAVKPQMGNKPVNFVTWYDAIRFANWLNNGQGDVDTETGAYTILGATPKPANADSITRNVGATWFLPSENEWYKSAYFDPRATAEGGPPGADHYWFYPTMSDVAPSIAHANEFGDVSNPGLNVANYNRGADWNLQDGNVTTVGSAGPLSASYYGTFDQGGNVQEWNERLAWTTRGLRGSNWAYLSPDDLSAAYGSGADGTISEDYIGFRVATTTPEPSTLALAGIGTLALLARGVSRRRGRKPAFGARLLRWPASNNKPEVTPLISLRATSG